MRKYSVDIASRRDSASTSIRLLFSPACSALRDPGALGLASSPTDVGSDSTAEDEAADAAAGLGDSFPNVHQFHLRLRISMLMLGISVETLPEGTSGMTELPSLYGGLLIGDCGPLLLARMVLDVAVASVSTGRAVGSEHGIGGIRDRMYRTRDVGYREAENLVDGITYGGARTKAHASPPCTLR